MTAPWCAFAAVLFSLEIRSATRKTIPQYFRLQLKANKNDPTYLFYMMESYTQTHTHIQTPVEAFALMTANKWWKICPFRWFITPERFMKVSQKGGRQGFFFFRPQNPFHTSSKARRKQTHNPPPSGGKTAPTTTVNPWWNKRYLSEELGEGGGVKVQ